MEEVELKVVEAMARDVGRGIARIDPVVIEELGLSSGDVVEIRGKKRTVARVWPGYPEDRGQRIIRIDGYIRRNAGVGIDDKVKVKKVAAQPAKLIKLAPTEELRIVGGEAYLRQYLENMAMTKGDVIEINIMGRKIGLVVTSHQPPADAVIVTYATRFR